jgi:hypothetical protein
VSRYRSLQAQQLLVVFTQRTVTLHGDECCPSHAELLPTLHYWDISCVSLSLSLLLFSQKMFLADASLQVELSLNDREASLAQLGSCWCQERSNVHQVACSSGSSSSGSRSAVFTSRWLEHTARDAARGGDTAILKTTANQRYNQRFASCRSLRCLY